MSESIKTAILELQQHLQSLEDESADTKRTINSLCKRMGTPPLYANVDSKSAITTGPIRADQYYGKALATVAREILESRQAMNLGPASVAEIYDRMVEGGFVFDTNNVDNAKRVLRISLAKNTAMFHKLPGGTYGLLEWYPAVKSQKKNGSNKAAEADEDGDGEEAEPVEVAAGAATAGDDTATPRKAK
jgi:hypothetical protein